MITGMELTSISRRLPSLPWWENSGGRLRKSIGMFLDWRRAVTAVGSEDEAMSLWRSSALSGLSLYAPKTAREGAQRGLEVTGTAEVEMLGFAEPEERVEGSCATGALGRLWPGAAEGEVIEIEGGRGGEARDEAERKQDLEGHLRLRQLIHCLYSWGSTVLPGVKHWACKFGRCLLQFWGQSVGRCLTQGQFRVRQWEWSQDMAMA